MTIQRAETLYLVNSTTVDTGVGIDVRFLDSATPPAGNGSASQSVQFTHTNDSVERTVDPATTSVTNTNNAGTTLFKTGWALRLTQDCTPVDDDTNCNVFLPNQTVSVKYMANPTQSGGTYASGSLTPTFRASLWRYNPASDTGTLIGAGSSNAISWTVGGVGADLGTAKQVTISVSVASNAGVMFQGEVLLLQIGCNTGTVPNPSVGTATFTLVFNSDGTNNVVLLASGGSIHLYCGVDNNAAPCVGKGTTTRTLAVDLARTPVGVGVVTATKATIASKTFSLVGVGVATRTLALTKTATVVGKGVIDGRIEIPIDEIPTGGGGTTITPMFAVLE